MPVVEAKKSPLAAQVISAKMEARLAALTERVARVRVKTVTRAALRLPDRMTVTEWAEANIHLDARTSAEPGPFRVARTPYLEQPLNDFADPLCGEIVFCASTQVGKTLLQMITMGYAADQSPGPGLAVQPTEESAREFLEERIVPLFKASKPLRRRIPRGGWAITRNRMRLDRMDLHMAWAPSASRLASKPKRYLWFDEVDKYPKFSGREADPVKLGKERARTYWNSKCVLVSTPTTEAGYIWRAYLECDARYRFYVPCPHCEESQALEFDQIKWPEGATVATIKRERNVWYECIHCGGHINDTEKERMVSRGQWVNEAPTVEGMAPASRGYWLWAVYSPWLTFWEIAAEFKRCHKAGPEAMMNFVNSWLAQVWQEREGEAELGRFAEIRQPYSPGIVPKEACILTAGIDVHKDNVYFVVRAWAEDGQSWLIDYGVLRRGSEYGVRDELVALKDVVKGGYEVQGGARKMYIAKFCMDRRFRTAEVDAFCKPFRSTGVPVMGKDTVQGAPWALHAIEKDRIGRAINKRFQYAELSTTYFKDAWLARYETDEPGWWVPDMVDDEYQRQLMSEARVVVGRDAKGEPKFAWTKKPGCKDNHFFDCEIYAFAAFAMEGGERGALRGVQSAPPRTEPGQVVADQTPRQLGHRAGWNRKGKWRRR